MVSSRLQVHAWTRLVWRVGRKRWRAGLPGAFVLTPSFFVSEELARGIGSCVNWAAVEKRLC